MPTTSQDAIRSGRLPATSRAGAWVWISIAAAILAMAGNIIALTDRKIYASLTPAFLPQALAQDIVNLALASPAILILAVLALRGSLRSFLLWLGVITFTVYNYVIYTFSVPFGPLFLLWVAVLGLCLFALIGGISAMDHPAVQATYTRRSAVRAVAWVLIVAAFLFAFLWLSEDIPALLAGSRPQSVIDLAVPTNPVHILDLSFFLPAVVLIGVWLLQKRPIAFTVTPAFLVFLIFTGLPILITPLVQSNLGETASWGAAGPIGALTVIFIGVLIWLMSTVRTG